MVLKQSQSRQSLAKADRVRDGVSQDLQTADVREKQNNFARAGSEVFNNLDVPSFTLHLVAIPSGLNCRPHSLPDHKSRFENGQTYITT